jgi:hypothetical protein
MINIKPRQDGTVIVKIKTAYLNLIEHIAKDGRIIERKVEVHDAAKAQADAEQHGI